MHHLKEIAGPSTHCNNHCLFHLYETHDMHPSSTRNAGLSAVQLTATTPTVKCFIQETHHIDGCQKSNTAETTTSTVTTKNVQPLQ